MHALKVWFVGRVTLSVWCGVRVRCPEITPQILQIIMVEYFVISGGVHIDISSFLTAKKQL